MQFPKKCNTNLILFDVLILTCFSPETLSKTRRRSSLREKENLTPEKKLEGNRPSTVILAPKLTPFILGQLIALYEHRTVASGVVWGVNPFDQWGVESGKSIAVDIELEMNKGSSSETMTKRNSSSEKLLEKFKIFRNI